MENQNFHSRNAAVSLFKITSSEVIPQDTWNLVGKILLKKFHPHELQYGSRLTSIQENLILASGRHMKKFLLRVGIFLPEKQAMLNGSI